MKKLFTLLSLSLSLSLVKADYWTQKANYPGFGQELPVSFSIGILGYVGCGGNASDFWEYNPITNLWTQKASVPGPGRRAGIGFSVNDKGYVGTGNSQLSDFYEYDPVTNSWMIKASMATGRAFAEAFSIGNKGYAGGGNSLSDFWEFDPAVNIWTQKSSLPFTWGHAAAFVIGDKGYFSTGWPLTNQTWQYDTTANIWTQRARVPGGARTDARGFTICEKGYVMTGGENPCYQDLWQYNAPLDQWIQKTNVPGGPRDDGASFAIGAKGYFGLGQLNGTTNTDDFWEYTPDSACTTGMEEFVVSSFGFQVTPNPAKEFIVINYLSGKENIEITITDVDGKKVYQSPLTPKGGTQMKISVEDLKAGVYFIEAANGKQKAVKKFVKE